MSSVSMQTDHQKQSYRRDEYSFREEEDGKDDDDENIFRHRQQAMDEGQNSYGTSQSSLSYH